MFFKLLVYSNKVFFGTVLPNRNSPRKLVGKVNSLENLPQTKSGNDLENAKHFALTVNNHNSKAAAPKYLSRSSRNFPE